MEANGGANHPVVIIPVIVIAAEESNTAHGNTKAPSRSGLCWGCGLA